VCDVRTKHRKYIAQEASAKAKQDSGRDVKKAENNKQAAADNVENRQQFVHV
jgi:hypothetical protein